MLLAILGEFSITSRLSLSSSQTEVIRDIFLMNPSQRGCASSANNYFNSLSQQLFPPLPALLCNSLALSFPVQVHCGRDHACEQTRGLHSQAESSSKQFPPSLSQSHIFLKHAHSGARRRIGQLTRGGGTDPVKRQCPSQVMELF